ncbi:MAG: UbiA family prenyltransferase [Thermoplasmata archaeon]
MKALDKLKAYFSLGRLHLAPFTSFCAVLGACTSRMPELIEIVLIFLVGIFVHSFAFSAYDLGAFSMHQRATALERMRSPLLSGKVTAKESFVYSSVSLVCAVLISLFSFRKTGESSVYLLLVCISILLIHSIYTRQKRFFVDFAIPLAVSFSVLYGAQALGGITEFTFALFPLVFLSSAFIIYENNLENVETDRYDGTKTLPVILGYREWSFLGKNEPTFMYGVLLKILFLGFCVGIILYMKIAEFTSVFFTFGILTQVYSIYLLEGRQNKKSILKLKLVNDSTTFILLSSLVISVIGYPTWLAITSFPLLWVALFSYTYHKYDWHGTRSLITKL